MKHQLIPYKKSSNIKIISTLEQNKNLLHLTFKLSGAIENYKLPKTKKQERKDELWRESCFELFLATEEEEAYYEFNFSPTLAWNVYRLEYYRAEPKMIDEVELVEFEVKQTKETLFIEIILDVQTLQFNSYNLATIVLNKQDEREFWSLKAKGDTPDFHSRLEFERVQRDFTLRMSVKASSYNAEPPKAQHQPKPK